jgi:hypothetical protein
VSKIASIVAPISGALKSPFLPDSSAVIGVLTMSTGTRTG